MLVYFAVMLTALLGFCGLVVDVGRMELRQVQLQAAADAGALSAATELQNANKNWQNAATAEVTNSANLNNFPMPTVSVKQGATLGAYAADNSTVEVTLTEPVSTIFVGLLGAGMKSATITARGVAMIPPCVFLMGPPVPGRGQADLALNSQGFNNLNCPMYARHGYYVDGFSHICCTTAKTPGPASSGLGGGWTSPAIQYSSPIINDPLAYIPAPAFSSCTYTGKIYTNPATISPGTYCGGLQVSNTTVTLQPGLYVITGGLTVNFSTLTGTGVTLYFTKGGGSGFGTVYINHSTMTLSAPNDASTGGIPAVLFFGDRSWSGGATDFNIVFSSNYGDGIFYTTNTGLYSWISNWSAPHYFTLITGSLSPQDSGLIPSANYSLLPSGNPLRLPVALVQ